MKREEHKTHSSFYRVNTTASLPLSFVSCVLIVAHYYQSPAFVCSSCSCSCSNFPLPPVTTHQPSGPQTQARNNEQVATVAWSGRFDHRSPTPRRASAGGSNHSRHRSNQPPQFLDWLSACRAPPTGKETKQEPHQSPPRGMRLLLARWGAAGLSEILSSLTSWMSGSLGCFLCLFMLL